MDISINVTVPKELISMPIVQDSIANFMVRKTGPEVKKLFRDTVYGWKNKPSFRQRLYRSMYKMSMTVWADDPNADQYQMVNYGTKPHEIRPRGNYPLRFKWGGYGSYKASSSPGVIKSKRHYKTGPTVFMKKVNHPGNEPRRFDIAIADEYEDTFRDDVQDAISVAAAKTAQNNP